jgi:hypothetical protein
MRFGRFTLTVAAATTTTVAAALFAGGCAGRVSMIPNPDPNLRKSSTQFAADAVSRHPFKADAPKAGEAVARAEVGYTLNRIDLVNLSNEDWNDVEVWVNQQYVVHLPKMEHGRLKILPFQMLYDDKGNYFPLDNRKVLVNQVSLYRDGKLYDVPVKLGD